MCGNTKKKNFKNLSLLRTLFGHLAVEISNYSRREEACVGVDDCVFISLVTFCFIFFPSIRFIPDWLDIVSWYLWSFIIFLVASSSFFFALGCGCAFTARFFFFCANCYFAVAHFLLFLEKKNFMSRLFWVFSYIFHLEAGNLRTPQPPFCQKIMKAQRIVQW